VTTNLERTRKSRRAVIFDLDGTLIDSTESIVNSFEHTFATVGHPPPTRQAILDSISFPIEEQFRRLSLEPTREWLLVFGKHYWSTACECSPLFPDARDCIEELHARGVRLGLATSKRRIMAEKHLKYLGLRHLFGACIGPDDVRNPKPHPEPLLRALEALEVEAENAIYVGDSPVDIFAAEAAGIRCICVTTGHTSRRELEALNPYAVVDNLAAAERQIMAGIGESIDRSY